MEFLQTVMDFLSGVIIFYGGGMAVNGLTTYGEGRKGNNGNLKDEGIAGIVGGCIIALVGLLIVPELLSLFPTV